MLVRDQMQELGRVPETQTTRQERQAPSISQLNRLDTRHKEHWPLEGKRTGCCACSAINKATRMKYECTECNVGLCATICFKVCHTHLHFWGPADTKRGKAKHTDISNYVISLLNWYFSVAFLWWNNRDVLLTQYCAGGKIEMNEMGRACGAYGGG